MSQTQLLDIQTWDLCLSADGNIAVASEPYALSQDVASACRTWLGEVYFDTTLGVPWRDQILGQEPPLAFVKAQLEAAALTVPGVTNPVAYITGLGPSRVLTGQVQFTDPTGQTQQVGF